MPERPEHFLRGNRPVDNNFEAAELLFRRYSLRDMDSNQRLYDATLQFPLSANRQKYSEPEDVLFSETDQYDGLGVVQVRVDGIPAVVLDGQGTQHFFRACHLPEELNYSHTHIQPENPINPCQAVAAPHESDQQ